MILLSFQLGIVNSIIDIASILMCSKQFFIFEEKRNEFFMSSVIKYDKLYYNDFMGQKRIYSEWKKKFFYPRAKSYI